MADESTIRVVITGVASDLRRALEGAKGDLGGLKAAIKDVPNQLKVDVNVATLEAAARLRSLQSQIGEIPDRISIDVDVDDGVANARLDLLNAKVRATERQVARAQLGGSFFGSGGGGGPGFISRVGSNLASGGLPGGAPLALGTAAAPLVAGAAGSITALAGSLGAAALGAGALGTSALGVLGAGLGSIVAVAIPAASGVKAVSTATAALEKAVADYGAKSKEAAQAQVNLNGAQAEAGPLATALAGQISALGDRWQEVSKPAQHALLEIMAPALKTVSGLMPTFAGIAKQALDAIGAALKPVFAGLSSPAFKKVLTDLGDAFAKLAGPLIGAGANLIRAFLNVAVAAAPYLIQIAQSFERWTRSFAESLSPGQHLNDLIKGLVGQLRSWWELAKALGGLMITIFKGGAELGQGLVDQLTHLLDKWNAWLHTTAGQEALHKFFVESLDLLKAVAGVLGPLAAAIGSMAVGLIPAMTTLLKPLAELVNTISRWVNNLAKSLPPVLSALPGLAVAVGVLASWKLLGAVVDATVAKMLVAAGLGKAGAAGAGVTAVEGAGAGAAGVSLGALAIPAIVVGVLAAYGFKSPLSSGTKQPGLASLLGPLGAQTNLPNREQLPTRGGGGAIGPVGSAQGNVTAASLKALADGLKGIVSPAQLSTAQLHKLQDQIDNLLGRPDLTKTQRDGLMKLENLLAPGQGPISAITKFGQVWAATFQGISATTGNVFTQVKDTMATDLKNISDNLGTGTKQGQQALVGSLSGALQTILDNTSATVRGTAHGIAAINAALDSSLKALGATDKAIKTLGPVVTAQVFTGFQLPTGPLPGRAGGGIVQVGRPGERGSDSVPMNVGGVPIRVAPGEKVGVFNYQQQAFAQRFIPGGVDGIFAATRGTRHDMAGGGVVGSVPAMIARATFDDSLHQPYLWGGGHGGFDNGPWDCSGAVSDILHAGGLLNAPRVSGDFMSYGLPGPGAVTLYANPTHVYMSIDGRFFGTSGSNPGGGAGWFPGAPRPGFVVRHAPATGGGLGSIQAPAWTGPGGVYGQIGKGAVAKAASAANQKLAAVMAASFGGAFGGGQPSEDAAVEKQVFDFFSAQGFNKVAIAGMLGNASQESSMNPSAPGGGLWQQISSFGSGAPPLAVQMATMLPQIVGLRNLMNSAASPGDAATIFMNNFEHPGIPALANRIAGANAAFAAGYAPGGLVPGFAGGTPKAHAARAARKPPAAAKHKHPKSTAPHAKFIPADALKGLLTPAELIPDKHAAGYARQATVLDEQFSNLLATQAANPVDDPELVTLSDADVKVLDPDGRLGYQEGDQIVNRGGMTAGRFFGPGGQILGGTFHRGATARLAQLAAILANRGSRLTALRNEQGSERAAIGMDERQIKLRQERKARIERYLHASVVRAGVVKAELDVLKSKNLAQALKDALSKQSIAKRLGGLRAHLGTVTRELTAEKHSQSQLIPLMKDPTHTQELEAQAQGIRDSIAVETQLGAGGSATVQRARSAIFANDLRKQLAGLEKTNTALGGKALEAGTGGAIGTILSQVKTLGADRDDRRNTLADFQLTQIVPARTEIASYLKEQADIGKLANIQVRTPATAAAAAGPDLTALNALLQTQLSQTQQALAISQAQFSVFQGFAPLLQGRLVGSFQSGIDFVPRTGVALVHRGETIIPDPAGPQGNRAAATVHTAQGPIEITVVMANNDVPLMKVIDTRIHQSAPRSVSDRFGQRARLLAGVRRP